MTSRILKASLDRVSMVIKTYIFSTNDDEKFTNVLEHPIAK